MNVDDLYYLIGRLTVEKEVLMASNKELQERIRELVEERAPKEPEKE